MKSVAVVGLGYVGLPLAVQAAEKGYKVYGIDLDKTLLEKITNRQSPYVNDTRFEAALARVGADQLTVGDDFSVIGQTDIVVICVPTPTIKNVPDLSLVERAAGSVAKNVHEGQLVVLESTVNPGATRDNVAPILQKASGLTIGTDVFLAHCPERIDPGNEKWFVGNLNRVVGGISDKCTALAVEFYESIIDAQIIPLGSSEEAEFTKSWENSHRNVLIALANEAAVICDALGMDVSNVIRGLQSKVDQFGLRLAQPGLGPGGHCIPEDIHYVIQKADSVGVDTNFLNSAAKLNDDMTSYAVHSLEQLLAKNDKSLKDSTVGLLGLAYKQNVSDVRRSPAIEVAKELQQKTSLLVHDPFVTPSAVEHEVSGLEFCESLDALLQKVDVAFVATAHDEYVATLTPDVFERHGIDYVFDGRNCLDKDAFIASGIIYKGVGR